jgi:hypothetical protein
MRIEMYVVLTDKRAAGTVVYVDPGQPLHCGIGLDAPQNIWGISLPPHDWREAESEWFLAASSRCRYTTVREWESDRFSFLMCLSGCEPEGQQHKDNDVPANYAYIEVSPIISLRILTSLWSLPPMSNSARPRSRARLGQAAPP